MPRAPSFKITGGGRWIERPSAEACLFPFCNVARWCNIRRFHDSFQIWSQFFLNYFRWNSKEPRSTIIVQFYSVIFEYVPCKFDIFLIFTEVQGEEYTLQHRSLDCTLETCNAEQGVSFVSLPPKKLFKKILVDLPKSKSDFDIFESPS